MAKFDMAKVRSSILVATPPWKTHKTPGKFEFALHRPHVLFTIMPFGNFFSVCFISYRSHDNFGNLSTMIQT